MDRKNDYTVALIVCYYGEFPGYFPLWLESGSRNSMLDFILVTENDVGNYPIPDNVHIVRESFEALRERFQRLFPFQISLEHPYKLCDFKPVYGQAFQEELKEYSFWGYCDIDMIFGNVEKYLTRDMLNSYEKLFMYGHFMLFRNNEKMRTLYQKSGSIYPYQKVLSTNAAFAFDEMLGMNKIAEKNGVKVYSESMCMDVGYSMPGFLSLDSTVKEEIFYKEGSGIYRACVSGDEVVITEYMYIHFSKKKPRLLFGGAVVPDSYYISMQGCRERLCRGVPDRDEIGEYTDYDLKTNKRKEIFRWTVNRFLDVMLHKSIAEKKIYLRNCLGLLLKFR